MQHPTLALVGNTYTLQMSSDLSLDIKIVLTKSGYISYTFKSPIGYGGRHYHSLCNRVGEALSEQYPDIDKSINLYNFTL